MVEHVRGGAGRRRGRGSRSSAWIDLGGAEASGGRYWTLDPIDGTKGFLRGEQYAVALGLIEDGEVVLGVLGCPNLADWGTAGRALLRRAKGQGAARMRSSVGGERREADPRVAWYRAPAPPRLASASRSSRATRTRDESATDRRAARHPRSEPFRIDSQCKYAAVARGDASIYLRMPTRKPTTSEKIWDHAAGSVIVEAAGGQVSDVEGRTLDFTQGRTLARNQGVVATSGAIHDEVIEAVRRVRAA